VRGCCEIILNKENNMTEEEIKEFKENFYKPSSNRDPNAAFVITIFRGSKNLKDAKSKEAKESKKD